MKKSLRKPRARFCASLHPEIFYALQVLSEAGDGPHSRWRSETLERFPPRRRAIDLPGALWTAVADVLHIEPTPDSGAVLTALDRVPDREFQERFLTGLLHSETAAGAIIAGEMTLVEAVASLPRVKREWLGHIGLYPVEPRVGEALDRLLDAPESFHADITATVRGFWDAAFARTWEDLLPAMQASVEQKQKLYEKCSFPEFLRHTLLPIEVVEKRGVLRALRGGYELPLAQVGECIFTPSAFNDSRFWTTYSEGERHSPWFPYCEPDIGAHAGSTPGESGIEPVPDIALIFRALGDATRFAMASLIGRYPRSAAELATALSVSRPTISHHLHILRSAGVVHETDHSGSVLISLNQGVLQHLSDLAIRRFLDSSGPLEVVRSRRTS
jgi:DNA-binding transcriptional ArsR family regulator